MEELPVAVDGIRAGADRRIAAVHGSTMGAHHQLTQRSSMAWHSAVALAWHSAVALPGPSPIDSLGAAGVHTNCSS